MNKIGLAVLWLAMLLVGCGGLYAAPVLWPFPQSEHKAFFERVPVEDFQFIPSGQGA
jgi:hypothetical protein